MKGSATDNKLAPITVSYSASTDLRSKTVLFSGTVLNYQVAFTGRSSMLTLTGILAHCGNGTESYVFTKANIEWVGGEDLNAGIVDGKSMDWIKDNIDNEDICAIIVEEPVKDEDGESTDNKTKRVYYNPGRIFKRIIHKYNGDLIGTTKIDYYSGTATYGNDKDQTVQAIVWNYFRGRGFSEQSTAAIMGNIQVESSFDPASLGDSGHAAGLFQWWDYGAKTGRWLALKELADSKGKDWTNPGVQCEYAYNEMGGSISLADMFSLYSGSSYPRYFENGTEYGWAEKINLNTFKNLTDVAKATRIFSQCFERPNLPNMTARIQYATEFYNKYTGKNITVSDNSTITQNNWRNWRYW